MTTQTTPPQSSQHLAAAQELLNELDEVTKRADADSQTKAVTAAAESILVLAEQVAAIRVLLVSQAISRGTDGQPAPANGQPAPQARDAVKKKRGWW